MALIENFVDDVMSDYVDSGVSSCLQVVVTDSYREDVTHTQCTTV